MSLFETDEKPAGRYTASDAEISPCGAYRYVLRRTWDASLARAWGHGGIVVVNRFAARTPIFKDLL